MKKFLIPIVVVGYFILSFPFAGVAQENGYEKYGRIATAVVREDYPGQAVVEYKYVGRYKKSTQDVTDTFRFEVMDQGKPKFVNVHITHNLNNKKLLTLSVSEDNRQ